MAGELSFGAADVFGLADTFSAAQTMGANSSFVVPRTSDTVTLNAIDGAAPINNDDEGAWGGFWRGGIKTIIGYSIARDAARNGVMPAPQQQTRAAQPDALPRWLLPVALVGLVAVLMHKAK